MKKISFLTNYLIASNTRILSCSLSKSCYNFRSVLINLCFSSHRCEIKLLSTGLFSNVLSSFENNSCAAPCAIISTLKYFRTKMKFLSQNLWGLQVLWKHRKVSRPDSRSTKGKKCNFNVYHLPKLTEYSTKKSKLYFEHFLRIKHALNITA